MLPVTSFTDLHSFELLAAREYDATGDSDRSSLDALSPSHSLPQDADFDQNFSKLILSPYFNSFRPHTEGGVEDNNDSNSFLLSGSRHGPHQTGLQGYSFAFQGNPGWKEERNVLSSHQQATSNDFLPFSGSPPEASALRPGGHPCHLIESNFEMESMCNHLMRDSVLALSYKIHAERSYQFVCLLQISTRTEDFLVDTMQLRHHLVLLHKVLCNPKITKVIFEKAVTLPILHSMLGLELVGVLDVSDGNSRNIFELADHLRLGGNGANSFRRLAYVCDSVDWRARPLRQEMVQVLQDEAMILFRAFHFASEKFFSHSVQRESSQMTHNSLSPRSGSGAMTHRRTNSSSRSAESGHQRTSSWSQPQLDGGKSSSLNRATPPASGHVRKKSGQQGRTSKGTSSHKKEHSRTPSRSTPSEVEDLFHNAAWGTFVEEKTSHSASSHGSKGSSAPCVATHVVHSRLSNDTSVPDSMEEIYQLSNANRKRNKEKKKRKGDLSKSESGSDDDEDEAEPVVISPKVKLADPQEFMRNIGWLASEKEKGLAPPSRSHRRTRSGGGDGGDKTKSKRRGKKFKKQTCTYPPKSAVPPRRPPS